ncbi:MAG: hypothetical protein GY716_16085 [bacterium]|nr:hypothetical protein [bacterium]
MDPIDSFEALLQAAGFIETDPGVRDPGPGQYMVNVDRSELRLFLQTTGNEIAIHFDPLQAGAVSGHGFRSGQPLPEEEREFPQDPVPGV